MLTGPSNLLMIHPAKSQARARRLTEDDCLRWPELEGLTGWYMCSDQLIVFPVKDSGQAFAKSSPDFQFAAAVASFGMLLRRSQHKGDGNFAAVLEIAAARECDGRRRGW